MTFLDGFSETDLRGGGTPPEGGFRTPGGVVLGSFWGVFGVVLVDFRVRRGWLGPDRVFWPVLSQFWVVLGWF